MKLKSLGLITVCLAALLMTSCGNQAGKAMQSAATSTSVSTTIASHAESVESNISQENTETDKTDEFIMSEDTGTTSEILTGSNADEPKHATNGTLYRRYISSSEDADSEFAWDNSILVEYNYAKKYVQMTCFFINQNAFLGADFTDALVPIDGEYWIQDFGAVDGSAPDLTKVYMNYSDSVITLSWWNDVDKVFENPSKFVFAEEFTD